jgi:carboxymethylenebutenolidase
VQPLVSDQGFIVGRFGFDHRQFRLDPRRPGALGDQRRLQRIDIVRHGSPDLFWRQEPGVDLSVTSEPDWQHGLRLYQPYDRDAGARDVKDTANVVAKLPGCIGRVAVLGYCLGGLMTFLTAVRYGVDAAVVYHGGDTEKYLGEIDGFDAPLLMHLAEEDEFISKPAQAEIKTALASKPNATVYSYPGQRHAFARHNGTHYNAAAAALATGRTSEFLNQQLR